MEAKVNYTVVGVIVLILIISLIVAGLWLSVGFDQKAYHTYEVYMHEPVSGLGNNASVKFNGVLVGFVKKIELNEENPQQVRLLLSIAEGTPITTSTSATLMPQGITGNTYIGLSATSAALTPLKTRPGQRYPIIPSHPSLLRQLDKVLKDVSENINQVSIKLNKIFDQENADYIKKTLSNFEHVTHLINQDSAHIHHSLENADVFLTHAAEISRRFPQLVTDLSHAANKTADAMQAGERAIDKISQQALPSAESLIRRLDMIAANLEKVSVQMRQNPSVLIRGTTPPKPGPGE